MASLFKTMTLDRISVDDAEQLLPLPRAVGSDPVDGKEIVGEQRSLRAVHREGEGLPHDRLRGAAAHDHARPGLARLPAAEGVQAGAAGTWPRPPLREFGEDPVSERPVVAKDGRFGVYVTDGETNASIGKGDRIEDMLPERAFELLAVRREQIRREGPGAKKAGQETAARRRRQERPAKKAPTAKKAGRQEGGAADRARPPRPTATGAAAPDRRRARP